MHDNSFSSLDFYNEFAQSFKDYSASKVRYLNSIDTIISSINTRPLRMIDLGAGDGRRGLKISKKLDINDVVLVDESSEMLAADLHDSNVKKVTTDISNADICKYGTYDLIICLWNVFGHLKYEDKRYEVLKNISMMARPNATIFIDVNNRYNIAHYGLYNVFKNVLKDCIMMTNGDFNFSIKSNDKVIQTSVHIFNPFELDRLIRKSGLRILKKIYINYTTGSITNNMFSGQILYQLCKK